MDGKNNPFYQFPPPNLPVETPFYFPPPSLMQTPIYPYAQNYFMNCPPPPLPFTRPPNVDQNIKHVNFNQLIQQRSELLNKAVKLIETNENKNKLLTCSNVENDRETVKIENKKKINITYYKENICKLQEIIGKLKESLEKLKKSQNEELNATLKNDVDVLRNQYVTLYSELNNENNLKTIRKEINKRKAKRKRIKKNKLNQKFNNLLHEKQIEQKHIEIDNNLKKLHDQIKLEKLKEEAKKAADETLHQVRKKLNDVKMMQEFCESIRKLRKIRVQHAREQHVHGEEPSEQEFENHLNELKTTIKMQEAIYENEKQDLILKLDLEKEKRNKKEKEKLENELKKYENKIKEILFGKCVTISDDDPLFTYKQYYSQSEYSLDSLLLIRQQWDQYIVPNGTLGASSIPLEWIYPTQASDINWSQYSFN